MSRKLYDYNTCYAIARQCSSSTKMKNLNGTAYNVARKNKWLTDYVWFERKQHTPYTYEEIYEIAKQYNCSSDFQKGNGSAYGKARQKGWIQDYTWFTIKHRAPYTREECFVIAKQYKTRVAFAKGAVGAYNAALNNGWLDDYSWIQLQQKPNNYWTKERVLEESKKYKTRGEFHDKSGTAYGKARTNGWLDECTWLKDERIDFSNDKIDCVYAYEFKEQNSVYIGRTLTRRVTERHDEHLTTTNDAVFLFAKHTGSPVPEIKILEDNLTLAEGVNKEGQYVEHYRKHGWNILNRTKTGGIGLLAKNKWSKAKCREEALKYKTRGEFAKSCGGAYDIARRKGWLVEYTWFEIKQKPSGYWHNYDNCYNAALKCKNISEFVKAYNPAYLWAKKQGWLKDYFWFPTSITKKKWYYNNCLEEARKYKLMSDFEKNSHGAYNASKRHGWIKDYDWLIRQHKDIGYWDYDHCYKAAQKYKSSTEFCRNNQTAWKAASSNKWLKDYTWFSNPNIKWTYEACKEAAQSCISREEYSKRYSGAYNVARINGWLKDYVWFVKKPNMKWTYKVCEELAKSSKGRDDFANKYGERAASVCRKNKWFDVFFPKQ